MRVTNNVNMIKGQFENLYNKSSKEIGKEGTTRIKAVTPVKTGKLKKNMTFESKKISNSKFRIIFGNSIEYAAIVNLKGKHRGFFNNALEKFTPDAERIVLKEIKKIRGIK